MSDPLIPKHAVGGSRVEGIRYGRLVRKGGVVTLVASDGATWTEPFISRLTPFGGATEGAVKPFREEEVDAAGRVTVRGDTVAFSFINGNRKLPVIIGCAVAIDARADLPYNNSKGDPNTFTAIFAPQGGQETKVVVDGDGLQIAGYTSINGGEALVKRSLLDRILDCLPELIAAHTAATGAPPPNLTALKLSLELDLGGDVGTYHTTGMVAK